MSNLLLYDHISQCVTMAGVARNHGRHPTETSLGIVADAAVVVNTDDNRIVWAGESAQLPAQYAHTVNRYSCEGELWLPELVECHTHLIYGGQRHRDYALRASGKTYQQIAASGGGILSTLVPTRKAGIPELLEQGLSDLERFQRWGVGTVEIKSGYGLTLESEIKILQCAKMLATNSSVTVIPTFMPAHTLPPEFSHGDDYVKEVIESWIPEVSTQKLAIFFDVFVETGFFNAQQASLLCEAALATGFKLKLHTDQFTDIGGTALALDLRATSCDHLDQVSPQNIQRFGTSDTVAVLLPGASLYTGTKYPPARQLIDAGARVALSTDFNPGTSPTRNLPLMTTLACSQMNMTVPEALAGITYNAAAALGLESTIGSIEPGKLFRVCNLNVDSYEMIPYVFGELA